MNDSTFTVSARAKKGLVAALVVAGLLGSTAGACSPASKNAAAAKASSNIQYNGQALTNQAYNNFQQVPDDVYNPKKFTSSTELAGVNERNIRYNNPEKISYIYLLSQQGAVVSYYTIKGKVHSNASQMTPTQNIVDGCPQSSGKDATGVCPTVVDAPQDDGSFGGIEPGIFFFTTDGVMVTWGSDNYLLSDAPLTINKATLTILYPDGSKPSSTAGYIK